MWKDPSQLHGFGPVISPFHTNGNDAFCFSVTGERLPIFRSHCQVEHSCISLRACVWGTGNGCWQHNGSMRMQYKSLIMPESWTAALKCTHHSARSTASRESRPYDVFRPILGFFFVCVCVLVLKSIWKISKLCQVLYVRGCPWLSYVVFHKWDQITLDWNHIPVMSPKILPLLHFSIPSCQFQLWGESRRT